MPTGEAASFSFPVELLISDGAIITKNKIWSLGRSAGRYVVSAWVR